MLEESYKQWIWPRIKDVYPENRFERSFTALNQFFAVNVTDRDFESYIREMAEAGDMKKALRMKNFSDLEIYLKAVYNTLNSVYYDTSEGSENEEKFVDLLKNVFHKLPDIGLTSATENSFSDPLQRCYFRVYDFRNKNTHESMLKMDHRDLSPVIDAMLVCYLDIAYSYRDEFAEIYEKKQRESLLDRSAFVQSRLNDYRQYLNGVTYLDVQWAEKGPSSEKLTVDHLLETQEQYLKLVGDAGSGKTMALRRIEYLLCKAYKAERKGVLPLYLELASLKMGDPLIETAAARVLGIRSEEIRPLFEHGEVLLLLDGYNEILDPALRRAFASELDALVLRYEQLKVFLSDRSAKAQVPVLHDARCLYLFELSLEDKLTYFRSNCKDPALLEEIEKAAKEDPFRLQTLNTPLKMRNFLQAAESEGKIPEDVTGSYLKMLMEREADEKKEENTAYLPVLLQGLAEKQGQFTRIEALRTIAEICEMMHFTAPDSEYCLNLLMQMGILQIKNDNMISFVSDDYRFHYLLEAEESGLHALLKESAEG